MAIKVISVLVLATVILLIEMPFLSKHSQPRDIIVFITLLSVTVVVCIAKLLMDNFPTPLYLVSWLFKPISNLIRSWS